MEFPINCLPSQEVKRKKKLIQVFFFFGCCVNIINRTYLFCSFTKIPSGEVALKIIWDTLSILFVSLIRITLYFRSFCLIVPTILVICFFWSALKYNTWYKSINIISKMRVNRPWVIKVRINLGDFIVWNNNPELLIPGALFSLLFLWFLDVI